MHRTPGHSTSRELASLRHAILQLNHEQRSAVDAFLHAPDPSVRAVARSLGISRWKASALLNSAWSQLSAQLRADDADLTRTRRTSRDKNSTTLTEMTHGTSRDRSIRLYCSSRRLAFEHAERLAKHLVECDECARELHLREAHREALLKVLGSEADRAIPEEYQPAHAEFEANQRELRVIARCVLEAVPAHVKAKLEGLGEPSPEQRAELRTLSDLHPPAFRVALAIAEASLALESLVLRFPDKVALYADGRVVRNGDEIPQAISLDASPSARPSVQTLRSHCGA